MLKLLIFIFGFGAVASLFYVLVPFFIQRYGRAHKEEARRAAGKLEEMYVWVEQKKLALYFSISPIIFALASLFLFQNIILVFAGGVVGFILPMLVIRQMEKVRRAKFGAQLSDALVTLSQSLKAGLSLLQAMEVLTEDMPVPISQEFALMVKENKMGVPLETSFERLNKKMDSEDLNLMSTAILVARETGGNLTDIFTHLSENIRIRKRINDQIKTLTTQARWQGIIMSVLPIIFAFFVINTNKQFFDVMLESEVGRILLVWCVISEVIGAAMLNRLSRVEV